MKRTKTTKGLSTDKLKLKRCDKKRVNRNDRRKTKQGNKNA